MKRVPSSLFPQFNSEQKKQERLEAISVLAAGLAHEIGNPLNSLTIHLKLLSKTIKTLKAKEKLQLENLFVVL